MEALSQRLDLMDERMEELEKENAGLKKEISLLQKQNIDYKDELSAVKSQLNSLDRKFKIKSQQETSSSTSLRSEQNEELSGIKDKVKSLTKRVTGLEKSGNLPSVVSMVTDDSKDKRLTNLEQQVNGIVALQKLLNKMHLNLQSKHVLEKELPDMKQRFEKLERVHDAERMAFIVQLTCSTGFNDQLTRLDRCIESDGLFKEDTCTFSLQEQGIFSILIVNCLTDGQIELHLGNSEDPEEESVWVSTSDHWKGCQVFPLLLPSDIEYSFFAKRISGNPKGYIEMIFKAIELFDSLE